MINTLHIKCLQFMEHLNADGFFKAVWHSLYKSEEVVTTTLNLSSIRAIKQKTNHNCLTYQELTKETNKTLFASHTNRSRAEKCHNYLNQGYRAFCAISDGKIIADIWYVSPVITTCSPLHQHVALFGLELNENDVYMFDMFVAPEYRGDGYATEFMHRALCHMRDIGYVKSYGYFSKENISALWIHRVLGHKELDRFKMKRFFVYYKATLITNP